MSTATVDSPAETRWGKVIDDTRRLLEWIEMHFEERVARPYFLISASRGDVKLMLGTFFQADTEARDAVHELFRGKTATVTRTNSFEKFVVKGDGFTYEWEEYDPPVIKRDESREVIL